LKKGWSLMQIIKTPDVNDLKHQALKKSVPVPSIYPQVFPPH